MEADKTISRVRSVEKEEEQRRWRNEESRQYKVNQKQLLQNLAN